MIRQKLIKTGSIFIPNELPANFGQTGPWAAGMAEEFGRVNTVPQTIEGNIPSPNEYLNYMPGGNANRLPSSYGEFTGQEKPPFFNTSGKFQQSKISNLQNRLGEYMKTYEGSTIPQSQYALEAGITGLPTGMGQQFYQEFLSLAQQKADDAKVAEEAKVKKETENKAIQDTYKSEMDNAMKAATSLVDDWLKAKSEGGALLGAIRVDENTSIDPLEKIIQGIKSGYSIEEIADWITQNNVPITNYQLQGLYVLYGQ
jgi:hypothetical protein